MKSYAYLHGFASSSASSKAQYFKARFAEHGIALDIPDLDGGDFENLTLSGQLQFVENWFAGRECVLLGSSMGGYLAALYAERHAEVQALVLLAPAFNFYERWLAALPAPTLSEWQATRKLSIYHYGARRQQSLDYGLIEDAQQYAAYPDFSQRAIVLHGLRDEIVPIEYSRTFCEAHANARLHEFRSGHELTNVLPEMWAVIQPFLRL